MTVTSSKGENMLGLYYEKMPQNFLHYIHTKDTLILSILSGALVWEMVTWRLTGSSDDRTCNFGQLKHWAIIVK